MNFGEALESMKAGKRVARKGWNGKDMWIELFKPDTEKMHSYEVLPTIAMKTADNKYLIGWLASQTDMLSDDWMDVLGPVYTRRY